MRYKVFVLSCFFCCSACEFFQDNNLPPYVDNDDYSSQQTPQASQDTHFLSQHGDSSQQTPQASQQTPQDFLPLVGQQPQQDRSPPTGGNSQNILVQKTCCRCSSGGSLISISTSQESSYNSELHKRCTIYSGACMMVVNCGEWKKQCENSQCSANVLQQL